MKTHTHLVILELGDQQESVDVRCAGGLLCASTREDRVRVAFVGVEGRRTRRVARDFGSIDPAMRHWVIDPATRSALG